MQEEGFFKSRIIQLAVIHVIRCLIVNQIETVNQTDIIHVSNRRSIKCILAVGHLIGANRHQEFVKIIPGVKTVGSVAIFLCNIHINNRSTIRENRSGVAGNHVDFAVDIGFLPSRFRQNPISLGQIGLDKVHIQLAETAFVHLLTVICMICSVNQVDFVAARHDQRILGGQFRGGDKVHLHRGVDRRLGFFVHLRHYFRNGVGLRANHIGDDIFRFGQIKICIRIVRVRIRGISGGHAAAAGYRRACGVVSTSAEQYRQQHHRSQNQCDCSFHVVLS